jgi:hypothetical protein
VRFSMHESALKFALRYRFRLARVIRANRRACYYYLTDAAGALVDTPACNAHTAAAAIRMMRRHLRQGLTAARAL